MSQQQFHVGPLDDQHDRASFACGIDALDGYFQQQASQDRRKHLAGVFVLHDMATNVVVGYYTLSSTGIEAGSLPAAITKRLPRYSLLPAVLLGRLAIDRRYHRQGWGRTLLLDALFRALATTTQGVEAMAVVVDAIDDDARRFYERHEFTRFIDDEYRLFIPMSTIARL